MLTGRLPFQSPLATTGTRADVPLSSSCGRFLDRALSLDPGDRPTSAKAFLAALEEALR
jgi:serine/threonine protein kinase